MDLRELIKGYSQGSISFIGSDGYPVGFPVREFRVDAGKVVLGCPNSIKELTSAGEKTCLMFHLYNEKLKGLSSVTFKGAVSVMDDRSLVFEPSSFHHFRQGGFLNTLRFIRNGKKRAKRYMRKRSK